MSLSTQIIVKGLDFEALTAVTASAHNQAIDEVTPGANVGVIIETEDTAGVPEVPDPSETYSGHAAAWLTKCLWKRVTATSVIYYRWNDNATSVATYLKWVDLEAAATAARAIADSAATDAGVALNTAVNANNIATAAQTTANTAQTTTNTAKSTADATAAQLAAFGAVPRGFILPSAYAATYSTSANQGWLECVGTAVSRTVFAELYALVGVTWGSGDGSTTFNLPDFRGRTLAGVGTGAGLTARVLGSGGVVGAEKDETLMPHQHFVANTDDDAAVDADAIAADTHIYKSTNAFGDRAYDLKGSSTEPTLGLTSETGEAVDDKNMQPTAFIHWYIKT